MFILPENYELSLEKIESLLPEAETKFNIIKTLDNDTFNIVVENTFNSNPELGIALASLKEEMALNEFIVKSVSSRGEVSRIQDRATRSRKAFQTTGLSKAKRREIARKVVRSKRSNPSATVRGSRKRKKAMKRRKAMGLS